MAFGRGDHVHLAGLGTGVVVELRGRARYAIEIKGRIVVAREADLESANTPSRGRTHAPIAKAGYEDQNAPRTTPSLDLHGKTTIEAVELVGTFINEAVLAGHSEVVIIHGRSGGRLKSAVHALLRDIPTVAHFRLQPHNPGATLATLA